MGKVKEMLIEEEEAVERAELLRGTSNEEQIDHDLQLISHALGDYCESCISDDNDAQRRLNVAFQNLREEVSK